MEFGAWALLVDFGFISLLLLAGKLIRAKVKLVQRLFIPSSIMAGLLGLALGPAGAGIIPFSDQISNYPTVLIALVFAALFLGQTFDFRGLAGRVGALWSYSLAMYVLQWGLGLLFVLAVLDLVWDLPDGFGLMLAAGWAGGFGTAAAVGSAFDGLGWAGATSLGFTSATVGVVVCIVGGLALTKWGARTGRTGLLADFDELPEDLRTGLIPPERRESIGAGTVSPSSLEPLALHLGIVLAVTMAAYYLSELGGSLLPGVVIPVFAVAFLVGIAAQAILVWTRTASYVDRTTVNGITGTVTDFLIAFGIASIVPSVVANYVVPLALLLIFGVVYCVVLFRYLTPRMFPEYWFERGIFTWGWATASFATGIALLRIVDPKMESGTLEDTGIAYMGWAPVEVAMATFAPFIVAFGFAWAFIGGSLMLGAGVLVFAWLMGWWATGGAPRTPG